MKLLKFEEKNILTMNNLNDKRKLIVYYGFAKLTKKVVRKRSIVIQYANSYCWNNEREQRYIHQKMHVVYERYQTQEEKTDSAFSNRSWTKWEYFVDDKRWDSNLDAALHDNLLAEENHVPPKIRKEIRDILEREYYLFYNLPKKQKGQLKLLFE